MKTIIKKIKDSIAQRLDIISTIKFNNPSPTITLTLPKTDEVESIIKKLAHCESMIERDEGEIKMLKNRLLAIALEYALECAERSDDII